MNVVAFRSRTDGVPHDWSRDERDRLVALARAAGTDVSFATGATEQGDPQFYLLGPAPEHECILCVSRLGRCYVVEDGHGRLLGEVGALNQLGMAAVRAALRGGRSLVARVTLALLTLRLTLEEKLAPVLEETEELLARFAVQAATLA
jgi:hypothetical protein